MSAGVAGWGAALLLCPLVVQAHSFGRVYNLPVPFWMYAYGAMAALALSFIVAGWFLAVAEPGTSPAVAKQRWFSLPRHGWLWRPLRWLGLAALALCIATGLWGNVDPFRNINMTLFWIVLVLGGSYLCTIAGDLYRLLNPWRRLVEVIGCVCKGFAKGRFHYPKALAYWPALALYMAFIWVELFGHSKPLSLAHYLLAYSGINLAGVWLVGAAAWFRYCEFFAVFMRLLALMAPLEYRAGRVRLRAPFAGLLEGQAEHISLLVFILFMLSSTAYDGLTATRLWFQLFWFDPTGLLQAWYGKPPIMVFPQVVQFYQVFASVCLVLSPFVYLLVFLVFVALAKLITRSGLSVLQLALMFAYSLLPIALVYNMTHYYTLILSQGVQIISLLSDPFGAGWNLWGTRGLYRAPILPDMEFLWHSQVALMVFGHIVSVVVAHRVALRLFASRGKALFSQLPMLLLMMLFTVAGLWILSQPIQYGR